MIASPKSAIFTDRRFRRHIFNASCFTAVNRVFSSGVSMSRGLLLFLSLASNRNHRRINGRYKVAEEIVPSFSSRADLSSSGERSVMNPSRRGVSDSPMRSLISIRSVIRSSTSNWICSGVFGAFASAFSEASSRSRFCRNSRICCGSNFLRLMN